MMPSAARTRLVVQHPALTARAVAAFSTLVNRAPTRTDATRATWDDVFLEPEVVQTLAGDQQVDAALVPHQRRLEDYRLIAFDMDSTLITIECVDEIAAFAGCKTQVAAITEAAMRGEIADYASSLRQRVALLAGQPESVLHAVYAERLALSPGVQTLLATVRRAGLHTLLVSGGFTFFTERLMQRLAFDQQRANRVEIVDGHLTGRLLGTIVDAAVKRDTVLATCATLGCEPNRAIVVGDGANDLEMMAVAGVSVAYRAKPRVRARATHAIEHSGLDAILGFFERTDSG